MKAPKKESHRKPPKPASWNCKRGTCRYCGEDIIEDGLKNTRKHWHQACANTWKVMNNPSVAQRVVLRRDKYTCQSCGHHDRNGSFDVDHIKPLFEANGDPSYWQTPNLRTLCKDCHKVKTREDMKRYYAARAALTCDKSETESVPQTAGPDLETPAAPSES